RISNAPCFGHDGSKRQRKNTRRDIRSNNQWSADSAKSQMHVCALATQSTGALLFVEQCLYAYQPCARLWRWGTADDKTRHRLLQSRWRISRGFYAITSLSIIKFDIAT